MNEDLAIRPMTAADLAAVVALAESLPEAPRWPRSAYCAALDPASMPCRIALVAARAQPESLLGFAMASLVPPQAELETVAVAVACQRQGIGKRLLRALAAALRTAGANEVLLEVRASNRAAWLLYRSIGFVATGRRPGYYREPEEDAVLMQRNLS